MPPDSVLSASKRLMQRILRHSLRLMQSWIPGAGLSRAEAACILSHRKAGQLLIESNDDYLAIFEDDVHVAADLSSVLASLIFQTGMDLVKLEIPTGKAHRHKASVRLQIVHYIAS